MCAVSISKESQQAGYYVQSDRCPHLASSLYTFCSLIWTSCIYIELPKVCFLLVCCLDSEKKYDRTGYADPVFGDSKRKNVSQVAYMVFRRNRVQMSD